MNMNLEMNYLRKKIMVSVTDIISYDSEENKIKNLEYLDMTIVNMCDVFKLISHDQAAELRKPIVKELENCNEK